MTSPASRAPDSALPPDNAPPGERADEDLARLARAGSLTAFDQLVERWHAPLYRFLWLRLGRRSDAEELTQETFLRAWRMLARYDARWRFSTWLFTLGKRLAVSHERARFVRRHVLPRGDEGLAGLEVAADPGREAAQREERERLWHLAARVLTREQRSALWLRYAEEQSLEEIAVVLKKRLVTVRGLLFRARAALARHLQEEDTRARPPRSTRAAGPGACRAEAAGGTR